MWKAVIALGCFVCTINATPLGKKNMQIMMNDEDEMTQKTREEQTQLALSTLNLPSNATSIRADLTDGFSCDNLTYGYYADIDNDCQVFHVCLPVVYADGKENNFRWSFICPEETIFSQEYFTCMRAEDVSIDCEESVRFYDLNRNFGNVIDSSVEMTSNEMETNSNQMLREKPGMMQDSDENESVSNDRISQTPSLNLMHKNKRKSPNRRPPPPIRKATATTTPSPYTYIPPATKPTAAEIEVTEATTKYQRFTRKPDQKDKKKPSEIMSETSQKRKRPTQMPLNSNVKNIIKNEEIPLNEFVASTTVPARTELPIIPVKKEQEKIATELKVMQPIIVEEIPLKEEIPKPTNAAAIITTEKMPQTIITVSKDDGMKPAIMMQQQDEKPKDNNADINKITPQILKVEESMPEKERISEDKKETQKNRPEPDQQSMIINLISNLVNAENTKVEDEQQKQNKVDNEKLNILPVINAEVTTTITTVKPEKIPKTEPSILDKMKTTVVDAINAVDNSYNKYQHQSQIYNHMSHIPVRILTDDTPLLPTLTASIDNKEKGVVKDAGFKIGLTGNADAPLLPSSLTASIDNKEKGVTKNSGLKIGLTGNADVPLLPSPISVTTGNKEKEVTKNSGLKIGLTGSADTPSLPTSITASIDNKEKGVVKDAGLKIGLTGNADAPLLPSSLTASIDNKEKGVTKNSGFKIGLTGNADAPLLPVTKNSGLKIGLTGNADAPLLPSSLTASIDNKEKGATKNSGLKIGLTGNADAPLLPSSLTASIDNKEKGVTKNSGLKIGLTGNADASLLPSSLTGSIDNKEKGVAKDPEVKVGLTSKINDVSLFKPIGMKDQIVDAEINLNKKPLIKAGDNLLNVAADTPALKPAQLSASAEVTPIFHRTNEPTKINLLTNIDTTANEDGSSFDSLKKLVESDTILNLLDPKLVKKPVHSELKAQNKFSPHKTLEENLSKPVKKIVNEPAKDESSFGLLKTIKNEAESVPSPFARLKFARSLPKRMDPRKRRFLFRSDSRSS